MGNRERPPAEESRLSTKFHQNTQIMASMIIRQAAMQARRGVQLTAVRNAGRMMADPLEHATGLERQEREAWAAGNPDPFDMRVYKRVAGDKTTPTLVPSFYAKRLVGCICEEDATAINWMWLERGETKRCECGYWFQLTEDFHIIIPYINFSDDEFI